MFASKPTSNPELEKAIAVALEQLNDYSPAEDDYHVILARVERLNALRTPTGQKSISPDTVLMVAGNILVTAMVVGHERAGVITSKFGQFIMKAKN